MIIREGVASDTRTQVVVAARAHHSMVYGTVGMVVQYLDGGER
jgi:hypothetical protein